MKALTGQQFGKALYEAYITQTALADESGVDKATISKWINGKQDVLLAGTCNKLIAAYEKLKED